MNIAFLLTCFNRKSKTQDCLATLFAIIPDANVYLVNDASTDGTREMVMTEFPHVHLFEGSGNLFWNRGMHYAWIEALKDGYDFYVWLNDDVQLYPDFLEELMYCYKICGSQSIISGLIKDKYSNKIIYGGTSNEGHLIQEASTPQPIKNMNGNVVLIPQDVVNCIGINDPIYWHDLGDVDYGLRALKNGIKVMSTRKAIANGYSNGQMCRIRKWGTNIYNRFKKLYSPLGSNPSIAFYFRKKHYGIISAIALYIYLHLINIFPDFIVKLVWGEKYVENNKQQQ